MSAIQSSVLVVWLATYGVNVLFGLSSSYVCLTVKRDQHAGAQLQSDYQLPLDAVCHSLYNSSSSISLSQALCPAKPFD
jgi:hypothetical protein